MQWSPALVAGLHCIMPPSRRAQGDELAVPFPGVPVTGSRCGVLPVEGCRKVVAGVAGYVVLKGIGRAEREDVESHGVTSDVAVTMMHTAT